ncbi:hypothetical protein [Streptomyces sp. NPDC002845]
MVAVQRLERLHVLRGEAHPIVFDAEADDGLQRHPARASRHEIELLLRAPMDSDGQTATLDVVLESGVDCLNAVHDGFKNRQESMALRQAGVPYPASQ